MVNVAEGAPETALADFVAPMAPEPFVPVVFTPVKVITVIEEATLLDNVADTATLVSFEAAKARQISEVPFCVFVRTTRAHPSPPPDTPVTVVFVVPVAPVDTKASTSSFVAVVENEEVLMVVFAVVLFPEGVASILIAPVAVKFAPVTLAPLTVWVKLVGANRNPVLLGVILYCPLAKPLNAKFPELSAVTVALAAPLKVRVAPLPFAPGVIPPEIV